MLAIDSASHGEFVAVDLAYPDRPGLPHRGVLVLDLARDSRWTFAWRYGDDDEPVSWKLQDTGVLEVTTPSHVKRFDRKGKALAAAGRHH